MELGTKCLQMFAVVVVLLMTVTWASAAKAWGGSSCGWNGCGGYEPQGDFQNCCSGGIYGYSAGEQDAIYDHDNGQSYNPIGSCLPCHSDYYWNNFREGYDHQWNILQSQQQDNSQGSSINIYGNNNYVSTNQYSNQQQNPLQQLAHTVCGWVNCNNNNGGGPEP